MVARSPVSLFMAWTIRPLRPIHSVSAPKSPMNQLWSVSAEASSISVTRGPSSIQQRVPKHTVNASAANTRFTGSPLHRGHAVRLGGENPRFPGRKKQNPRHLFTLGLRCGGSYALHCSATVSLQLTKCLTLRLVSCHASNVE